MNLAFSENVARWNPRVELTAQEIAERDDAFRALVPGFIAEETAAIREQLAAGANYVINGDRNLIHDHNCSTLRHLIDRERAWREAIEMLLSEYRNTPTGPTHARVKMPHLATRAEVERLTRYEVCQICSPDTDTRRKRRTTEEFTIVTAQNIHRDQLGREILDDRLQPIGTLNAVTIHTTANECTVTIHASTGDTTVDGEHEIKLRRRAWATHLPDAAPTA